MIKIAVLFLLPVLVIVLLTYFIFFIRFAIQEKRMKMKQMEINSVAESLDSLVEYFSSRDLDTTLQLQDIRTKVDDPSFHKKVKVLKQ